MGQILTPYVLEKEEEVKDFVSLLLTNQIPEFADIEEADEENDLNTVEQDVDAGEPVSDDIEEDEWTGNVLQSDSGKILFRLLMRIRSVCGKIYVIYVPYYDDRYYKSSFALYYSGKHFTPQNHCGRVFLFDGPEFDRLQNTAIEDGEDPENPYVFEKSFIGSIVKKPIPGMEIGRTLINPQYLFSEAKKLTIRTVCYSETMYGIRLHVYAFPYAMQDGETVTCAEITIQNLSDYFSRRYQSYYNIYPDEITALAQRESYERTIPSRGLSYQTISKILMDIGFAPRLYASKYDQENFLTMLHAYMTSGIPMALGIDDVGMNAGHSVIAVGMENDLRLKEVRLREGYYVEQIPNARTGSVLYLGVLGSREGQYVLMDDGRSPYAEAIIRASYSYRTDSSWKIALEYEEGNGGKEKENQCFEVSFLIAPLSKEMAMDAAGAIECFKNILGRNGDQSDSGVSYTAFVQNNKGMLINTEGIESYIAGETMDNPLLLRPFLCPSRSLKKHRLEHVSMEVSESWLDEYRSVHMPRFVWVCELYSMKSIAGEEPYCIGEIVLDASASSSHTSDFSSIIMIDYPGMLLTRHPGESETDFIRKLRQEKVPTEAEINWPRIVPFEFSDKSLKNHRVP